MRQAGIIAAAGVVALESMVDRLSEDHTSAKRLAHGLSQMPALFLNMDTVQTNIVIFEVMDRPAHSLIEELKDNGVLVSYMGGCKVRMVTHYGISAEDIDETLNVIEAVVGARGRGNQ